MSCNKYGNGLVKYIFREGFVVFVVNVVIIGYYLGVSFYRDCFSYREFF